MSKSSSELNSPMKCSVYIATSTDGFIATHDGGVDWLHTAGNSDATVFSNDFILEMFGVNYL